MYFYIVTKILGSDKKYTIYFTCMQHGMLQYLIVLRHQTPHPVLETANFETFGGVAHPH